MPVFLGRHELLVRLAAGGAANVFLVRDADAPPPGRLLALKVLLPNLAANEDFLNMFFTEARIASRLKHPNIVKIAGFGRMGGIHCLAMEYVFGASLAQLLRQSARTRTPLTVGVLLRIAEAMCSALHYAHEMTDESGQPMALVHRDVTPQNILIGFNGVPKLTDFGIAKATDRGWETQVGVVKGKFCYMSPEQALGNPIDRRSDVFGLGIVLWEALTGRELFKGTSPVDVLNSISSMPIVPPSQVVAGLSPIVDPIVMRALHRDPTKRFQSARSMKHAIETLIQRAGVTIDAKTISEECATIFGDAIVKRAFSLRGAMAGSADPEELSRVLGGHQLLAEHLPEMSGDEVYVDDPLGLFAAQPTPQLEYTDDSSGGAIPAAPQVQFTAQLKAPNFEAVSPTAELEPEDFSEIDPSYVEYNQPIEEIDLDEWNDRTRQMEPNDELLAMLSEEDATVGMVPDAFNARFGHALDGPGSESSADFDDESTLESQRRQQREVASSPRANPIENQSTLMQPRTGSASGPLPRPVPRAPSLDMPRRRGPGGVDVATMPGEIRPGRLGSDTGTTPISPEMIQPNPPLNPPRSPSTRTDRGHAIDVVPLLDPGFDSGTDGGGVMGSHESLPPIPVEALMPIGDPGESDVSPALRPRPAPAATAPPRTPPSGPPSQSFAAPQAHSASPPSASFAAPQAHSTSPPSQSFVAPAGPAAPISQPFAAPSIPPSAPPPVVPDPFDDSRDALAASPSNELSPDALRALASERPSSTPNGLPLASDWSASSSAIPGPAPHPPAPPAPHSHAVAVSGQPAAPAQHQPVAAAPGQPVPPAPDGLHLNPLVLFFVGLGLVVLGVIIGVVIVRLFGG